MQAVGRTTACRGGQAAGWLGAGVDVEVVSQLRMSSRRKRASAWRRAGSLLRRSDLAFFLPRHPARRDELLSADVLRTGPSTPAPTRSDEGSSPTKEATSTCGERRWRRCHPVVTMWLRMSVMKLDQWSSNATPKMATGEQHLFLAAAGGSFRRTSSGRSRGGRPRVVGWRG